MAWTDPLREQKKQMKEAQKRKKRNEKYKSNVYNRESPMVQRVLLELGKSLFGSSLLKGKNYSIKCIDSGWELYKRGMGRHLTVYLKFRNRENCENSEYFQINVNGLV